MFLFKKESCIEKYSMTSLLVQHYQQQQKQPNCNKDNKFSRIFCARKYHPWSVLWRVIDCSSFVPGPSTSVRGVIKSPGQNSNSGFVGNQALFVLIMSITPSICGTCNRIYEEKKMYGFFSTSIDKALEIYFNKFIRLKL